MSHQFRMISPYVLTEDERILRKVINSGHLLVSLVPVIGDSRDNIKLIEQKDRKYSLTIVDHNKLGYLSFSPSYNIGDEVTMVFEFTINSIDWLPDVYNLTSAIKLKFDKAKLKAKGLTMHDRVYVVISKKGTQKNVYSSLVDALTVDVEPSGFAVINSINLNLISLISFHLENKMYDMDLVREQIFIL